MNKLKKLSLIIFSVILTGCSTASQFDNTSQSQLQMVFKDFESFNGSVCLGISGPYSDKVEGIKKATENCAEMLSINKALSMQSDIEININTSKKTDTFDLSSIGIYDRSIYEDCLKNLEIVDVKWYGGDIGAVVYAKCGDPIDWSHQTNWINKTIEISGSETAIGSTFEYYYIQDSLEAASFEAAVALNLQSTSLVLSASETITSGNKFSQEIIQFDISTIAGFRVLSFDYDPETKTYYALAVCEGGS